MRSTTVREVARAKSSKELPSGSSLNPIFAVGSLTEATSSYFLNVCDCYTRVGPNMLSISHNLKIGALIMEEHCIQYIFLIFMNHLYFSFVSVY